tara:strand:- start:218 stop:1405 length:1188 start_codon:yes stop_codon:yes gene_type:complete
MTQINWQYQVNNRAGGYIVTNTDWNDVAGDLRAFIDQTTSSTTDNTPLPIGIDLANDRVYISDPDSTTPEDANHADTTLSVVGTTTLNGNTQQTGTFTVGVSDTGHDVKFWGDTAAKYMLWDTSEDRLDATGEIRASATDTYPVAISVGNAANGGNIAIGALALAVNTGGNNLAVGYNALNDCTSSGWNTAVGNYALDEITDTTGQYNTAVGFEALSGGTANGANVAMGFRAGLGITGDSNTAIGMQASQGTFTGDNNTCLGNTAAPLAEGTSNSITLGNSSISTLRCQVTSISALSDERDKTDIEDLDMGLDFIQRLRPVRFVWDMRDEDGKHGIGETGFIAQELQQAQADEGKTIPNLISDENPDRLEAAPGTLLPALVKAIQELDDKVEALT